MQKLLICELLIFIHKSTLDSTDYSKYVEISNFLVLLRLAMGRRQKNRSKLGDLKFCETILFLQTETIFFAINKQGNEFHELINWEKWNEMTIEAFDCHIFCMNILCSKFSNRKSFLLHRFRILQSQTRFRSLLVVVIHSSRVDILVFRWEFLTFR